MLQSPNIHSTLRPVRLPYPRDRYHAHGVGIPSPQSITPGAPKTAFGYLSAPLAAHEPSPT